MTPPLAAERPEVAPLLPEATGDENDTLVERYTYRSASRKALAFLAVGAFALALYPRFAAEPPDPLSPYALVDDVKLIGTINTWRTDSAARYFEDPGRHAGRPMKIAGRVVDVLDRERFVIVDSGWRPRRILVINRVAPVMDQVLKEGDKVIVEGFVSADARGFDAVLRIGPSPSAVP